MERLPEDERKAARGAALLARWQGFLHGRGTEDPDTGDFLAFGSLSTLERLRTVLSAVAPDQCGPLRLAIAARKREKTARRGPQGKGGQRGPQPSLSVAAEALPATWQALLAQLREARGRIDLGVPDLADLRPPPMQMIRQTEYVLRSLAFQCLQAGREVAITHDSVRLWLDAAEARGNRPTGLSLQLGQIRDFAARLGADPDLIETLRRAAAEQAARARPLRKRKAEKLVAAPMTLADAWERARALLDHAGTLPAGSRARVKAVLDAAAIALAVAAPLRIGDLHRLVIGESLTRSATGWHVAIRTAKTGLPHERPLWPEVGPFLDAVIKVDAPGAEFWPGYDARCGSNFFSIDGGRTGMRADWVSSVWQHHLGIGAHIVRTLWHELVRDETEDRTHVALGLCAQRSERTAKAYRLEHTRSADIRRGRVLLRAARERLAAEERLARSPALQPSPAGTTGPG